MPETGECRGILTLAIRNIREVTLCALAKISFFLTTPINSVSVLLKKVYIF